MLVRWRGFLSNDAGNVTLPFPLSLMLLPGLAVPVIDPSHAYVVKREMHAAAAAGAIAPPPELPALLLGGFLLFNRQKPGLWTADIRNFRIELD